MKELIQPAVCLKPLSLCLQALCAVGLCGGRDLWDQGCQTEGESLTHRASQSGTIAATVWGSKVTRNKENTRFLQVHGTWTTTRVTSLVLPVRPSCQE